MEPLGPRNVGHHIPDDVVARRYRAGIRNMRHLYLPLSDTALTYDNSDMSGILIASRRPNAPMVIHDADRWSKIDEVSR
jgi:predicted ABC-type ATPase